MKRTKLLGNCQKSLCFAKAYAPVTTLEMAINEFRKTEIHQFDPDLIHEHDFIVRALEETKLSNNVQNDNNKYSPKVVSPREIQAIPITLPIKHLIS